MKAADQAGRDSGDITCIYNVEVRLAERSLDEPLIVAGPAAFVIDRLRELVALGLAGST
jgi:hypothetical protein